MSEFEDILEDVGSFGPFQVTVFILVSMFETPAAWAMVLPIFTVATPAWNCHINDTVATSNGNHDNGSQSGSNGSLLVDNESKCELLLAGRCDRVEHVEHFTSVITEVSYLNAYSSQTSAIQSFNFDSSI